MIKTRRFIAGEGWTSEKIQPDTVQSICIQIGDKTAYIALSDTGEMSVHIRDEVKLLLTFNVNHDQTIEKEDL